MSTCYVYSNGMQCREKVVVNSSKTNLLIQGQGYTNTAIEWNDTANSTGGTIYSCTFAVSASNFIAYNISFLVIFFLAFVFQLICFQ